MSESDSSVPDGFRQIPGYPRYSIDESGNMLSIRRRGAGPDRQWSEARQLCPKRDRDGYLRASLRKDNHRSFFYVHVLVLMAFVGPRPEGMQCRHLDGSKDNNHVSNLAWGTAKQNQHDSILHGTASRGEKCGTSKLKPADVLKIRRRRANGEILRVIADDFRVSFACISHAANRRTWKHIA